MQSWKSEADKDDGEVSEDSSPGSPEPKPEAAADPAAKAPDAVQPENRTYKRPIIFFIHGKIKFRWTEDARMNNLKQKFCIDIQKVLA